MIQDWYEVWVDETPEIPYVLFVYPNRSSGEVSIVDPKKDNEIIQTMPSYQAATDWLQEDEYILVDGRMEIDY